MKITNLVAAHGACALAAVAMLSAGAAVAGSIDASTALPSVSTLSANSSVIAVKHIFDISYIGNDQASCGARLDFSDDPAATKNVTLTQSTTPKQVVVDRQYKSAGVYKVTLSGYAWGNYKACSGAKISTAEIKSATVTPKSAVSDVVESTLLTKISLKKTEYAPGSIDLYATIDVNKAERRCAVDVAVTTLNGGSDPVNSVLLHTQLQGTWLSTSSDFHAPPFDINATGMYRVTATGHNAPGISCHGTAYADFEVKRQKLMVGTAPPKLTKIALASAEFSPGAIDLMATVQSDKPSASCQINASVFTSNSGNDAINAQLVGPLPYNFSLPASAQKLSVGNLQVGKYRLNLSALQTANPACVGEASVDFEVKRKTLAVGTEIGSITGMFMKSSASQTPDSARQDEEIQVTVQGSVDNAFHPEKQCGWSLFVVNSGGQGKYVSSGNSFFKYQLIPAGTLSGYAPGKYTLHVKSSSKDDAIANVSCKGEANMPFTLLKAVAVIKDVRLKSFGQHFNAGKGHGPHSPGGEAMEGADFCANCMSNFSPAHDIGGLRITPVFAAGQECSYAVIQKFNGKTTTHPVAYLPGNEMAGAGAMSAPGLNVYSDDSTVVTVTLVGAPHPFIKTLTPCQGTVTKTITVHDDPNLPAVSN